MGNCSGERAGKGRYRMTPDSARAIRDVLLHEAQENLSRVEYLWRTCRVILEHSGAEAVGLWLAEDVRCVEAFVRRGDQLPPGLRVVEAVSRSDGRCLGLLEQVARRELGMAEGRTRSKGGTRSGIGGKPPRSGRVKRDLRLRRGVAVSRRALLVPLAAMGEWIGFLGLSYQGGVPEGGNLREVCGSLGTVLGEALVTQKAHAALHERVKELTCLYGITQVSTNTELDRREVMQRIVELLPPAWQYPEIASARIVLGAEKYVTSNFVGGPAWQTAAIEVGGEWRGAVEVFYREDKPEQDEGPFLAEERSLISAVARQVSQTVSRWEAADERARLQEQLRHADRLATIGQLAAGVAHELNEPLSSILGFAQLASRAEGLPERARIDLQKTISGVLYAREIVKKLMLFARQTPPSKRPVSLNAVIEEGLDFLASRCAKQGVEVVRHLDSRLPMVTVDPGQMQQVLVNLIVNAVQAMPEGGTLTIRTSLLGGVVRLVVEDTGFGMSRDVVSKIFLPFFTTKDVDQGTGLGLSVVHGIVTAHGGTVTVSSALGQGSRLEVRLPFEAAEEG